MNNEGYGRGQGEITKIPIVMCPPAGGAYLVGEGRRLVCLVRHGQTDWNIERRLQGREPVPLNGTGIEQSVECGKLFVAARDAGLEIGAVFVSPMERAAATAKAITDALGVGDATIVNKLIERDYGTLSGLTPEERRELHRRGGGRGIESVASTALRTKRALVEIYSSTPRGAAVAVTHGGVINALFSCVTLGATGTGKNYSENCGVSLVAVGRDATIPLAYGLTGDIFLDYIREYTAALGAPQGESDDG